MSEITLAELDADLLPERQTLSLHITVVQVANANTWVACASQVFVSSNAGNAIIIG
jgi:hypothetical protein